MKNLVTISGIALPLALALAWAFTSANAATTRTATTVKQDQAAQDAPHYQAGKPTWGAKSMVADGQVRATVHAHLLPVLTTNSGTEVRPAFLEAEFVFEDTGALLGKSQIHELILGDAAQSMDLSSTRLFLSSANPGYLDANAATIPEGRRKYSLSVHPAAGKTWGSVTDFDEDLVFDIARIE